MYSISHSKSVFISFCFFWRLQGEILFLYFLFFQYTNEEIILCNRLANFWGKFAHGSMGAISPYETNGVAWPVYNETTDLTMKLDVGDLEQVQQGRYKELCDMWDSIGYCKF